MDHKAHKQIEHEENRWRRLNGVAISKKAFHKRKMKQLAVGRASRKTKARSNRCGGRHRIWVNGIKGQIPLDKVPTCDSTLIATDAALGGDPHAQLRPAACGYFVGTVRDGHPRFEYRGNEYLGVTTTPRAEALAIIRALKSAIKKNMHIKAETCLVFCDSKLVVNITTKKWKVRNQYLKILVQDIRERLSKWKYWAIKWVPRAKNITADKEAKKALQETLEFLATQRGGQESPQPWNKVPKSVGSKAASISYRVVTTVANVSGSHPDGAMPSKPLAVPACRTSPQMQRCEANSPHLSRYGR